MDANSNRLRLKLDMVFRDLPAEEAQKRFAELSEAPPEEKALAPVGAVVVQGEKKKRQRKTVKALVPK